MRKITLSIIGALIFSGSKGQSFVKRSSSFGLSPISINLAFADIDNDGDMDAFGVEPTSNAAVFWRNTGTPTAPSFTQEPSNFGLNALASGIDLADLDDDGDLDAFTTHPAFAWQYWENTGSANSPSFTAGPSLGMNPNSHGIDFVDIDNDGDLDAYCADNNSGTTFWRNTGTKNAPYFSGGFFAVDLTATGYGIDFIDIDKNGTMDCFSDGTFWMNIGTAASQSFTRAQSPANYGLDGSMGQVRFVDIDHDGDLDAFSVNMNEVEYWEFVVSVGIDELSGASGPKLYPNPFKTSVTIETSEELSQAELIIYNVLGQPVKSCSGISGRIITISRDQLPEGTYTYQVVEKNTIRAKGVFIAE